MTLAEKIQLLRKGQGMSQEELAEKCHVSRQSISKWEADITLPELNKLLIISNLFDVSMDFLVRDEWKEDLVKTNYRCHIQRDNQEIEPIGLPYEGILIKESIEDENILDAVKVQKVELWSTVNQPKYWTAIYFQSEEKNFPELLSKALKSKDECGINWFCDMKQGNIKWIIFRKAILKYTIGDESEKQKVCEACRKLGIPEEQIDWQE